MKTKIWIVIILAVIALGSGLIYHAHQPAEDLGPVAAHHEDEIQPQAPDVEQTTPAPAATSSLPQPKPAAPVLKTFSSSKYGFSFQYPEDFDFDGTALDGSITNLHKGRVSISIQVIPQGQDSQYSQGPGPLSKVVVIGPNPWQRLDFGDLAGNDTKYFIETKNKKYWINFDVSQGGLLSSRDQDTVNQILSTFKLTK